MKISTKRVRLTPLEDVKHSYWFIMKDYKEGLNYQVSEELFKKHSKVLAELLGIKLPSLPEKRDAYSYLSHIYSLLTQLHAKLGKV